jgi:Zeta toxin
MKVLTMVALEQGKNVLVDGSLRDAEWYSGYIRELREAFPKLKVAIINVTAREETVLARARQREEITGRHVPPEVIRATMEQIPTSLRILKPLVNYVATFENEDRETAKPMLVDSSKRASSNALLALGLQEETEARSPRSGLGSSWHEGFKNVWKMTCAPKYAVRVSSTSSDSLDKKIEGPVVALGEMSSSRDSFNGIASERDGRSSGVNGAVSAAADDVKREGSHQPATRPPRPPASDDTRR